MEPSKFPQVELTSTDTLGDPRLHSAPFRAEESTDGLHPPDDASPAEIRRQQRMALIEEFGGQTANLKVVAREALRRGMYSPRTNPCDVELFLLRTWRRRNRRIFRPDA